MTTVYGFISHLPSNVSPKGEPEFVFAGSSKRIAVVDGKDVIVATSATRTLPTLAGALKAAESMSGAKGLFARELSAGRCWEVTDENPAQVSIPASEGAVKSGAKASK